MLATVQEWVSMNMRYEHPLLYMLLNILLLQQQQSTLLRLQAANKTSWQTWKSSSMHRETSPPSGMCARVLICVNLSTMPKCRGTSEWCKQLVSVCSTRVIWHRAYPFSLHAYKSIKIRMNMCVYVLAWHAAQFAVSNDSIECDVTDPFPFGDCQKLLVAEIFNDPFWLNSCKFQYDFFTHLQAHQFHGNGKTNDNDNFGFHYIFFCLNIHFAFGF